MCDRRSWHIRWKGLGGGNEAHAALKDNVELPTRLLLAHELEIERRVHARVLVGVAEDPPSTPHSTLLLVPSGIQEQLPGLVTGVKLSLADSTLGCIEAAIVRKGHGGDRGRRHAATGTVPARRGRKTSRRRQRQAVTVFLLLLLLLLRVFEQ